MHHEAPKMQWLRVLVWLLAAACSTASGAAEPAILALKPGEGWSSVFADSEIKLHYTLSGPAGTEVAANWKLTIADRTVERGHIAAALAENGSQDAVFTVRIPHVKAGNTVAALLTVELESTKRKLPPATLEKPIWIFVREAFADRQVWLKKLKIGVYDPEKSTADALEGGQVFFERLHGLPEPTASPGTLIVGEGMTLERHRIMFPGLAGLAAAGWKVILLAPTSGSFPAVFGGKESSPLGVSLRRNDVITELDKRLDAIAWMGGVDPVLSKFEFLVNRGEILAEVSKEPAAWPWLDVRYPSGGRLIVCGFGIVAPWEKSPVPRYLLRRILEILDNVNPHDNPSTNPPPKEN
jgi:hypothetical protein